MILKLWGLTKPTSTRVPQLVDESIAYLINYIIASGRSICFAAPYNIALHCAESKGFICYYIINLIDMEFNIALEVLHAHITAIKT